MRVAHDAAAFDIAVLFKETLDFSFAEPRCDTGDEKVGALVGGFILSLIHI